MKRTGKELVALAAVLGVSAAFNVGHAETLTASVRDVTTISNGNGASRVLFDFAGIGNLGDVAVSRATLRFSLSGSTGEGKVLLRLHPVTSSWNPGGVSWSGGWSRAGGDFDETVYSRTEVNLSRQGTVSIDATVPLRESLVGGMSSHGFLLTVDPRSGEGLNSELVGRLQNLGSATLELNYRKVPPKPRGA